MPSNGLEDVSPEAVGPTSSGLAIASTEEAIVCPLLKAVIGAVVGVLPCRRVPSV